MILQLGKPSTNFSNIYCSAQTSEGYYNYIIKSDDNTVLANITKTGAGKQVVVIEEFIQCVNIILLESNTNQILDNQRVCKT